MFKIKHIQIISVALSLLASSSYLCRQSSVAMTIMVRSTGYCLRQEAKGKREVSSVSQKTEKCQNGKIEQSKQDSESELKYPQEFIYVNPNRGNDQQGRGTETSPFQTITQALMLAEANTVIMLSEGIYSSESGEIFPLLLNNNVTIQGHPKSQGLKIVIQGNGPYISKTGAGQNVTIVATETGGKLTGVTVTNPHPRGYGVWIESSNPEISNNTFIRNGGSGICINGESNPLIQENYFYQNRGNGLVIYGKSQPYINNNIIENSGFGISVLENSAARIENNQITNNRLGIILEENAQAILRNNVIEKSKEHGLVAIAQSRVDLGTNNDLGNNLFQKNRGLDIRNLTTNSILAVGTKLSGNFEGQVDFGNSLVINTGQAPAMSSSTPANSTPETGARNSVSIPTPMNSQSPDFPQGRDITTTLAPQKPSYRVVVEATPQQVERLKDLYPDAFSTVHNGQKMLQVGLFGSWDNAQQVLGELQSLGLRQMIVIVEY